MSKTPKAKKKSASKPASPKKRSPGKAKPVLQSKAAPSVSVHPDTLAKIQDIIAGQLKKQPGDIRLDAQLQKDLGADSLDALEIIFNIEEGFDIQVLEDEAKRMVTVQDVVSLVELKRAKPV